MYNDCYCVAAQKMGITLQKKLKAFTYWVRDNIRFQEIIVASESKNSALVRYVRETSTVAKEKDLGLAKKNAGKLKPSSDGLYGMRSL